MKLEPNTTEERIALIRAVADGREVEARNLCDGQSTYPVNGYLPCDGRWCFDLRHYTIKPRTIRIGEYDVPEPMRVAPEVGAKYWLAHWSNIEFRFCFLWTDSVAAHRYLERGLIHDNAAAAILHGKALVSLTTPKRSK